MEHHCKKGYLKEPFQIFDLSGTLSQEVPFHYHDFKKIIICINGNIQYSVEGKQYEIQPSDIIIIDSGEIHRPIMESNDEYERIILYISSSFIVNHAETDLSWCFQEARRTGTHVYRSNTKAASILVNQALSMTTHACIDSIAPNLLQTCRLTEFLIQLNDFMQHHQGTVIAPVCQNPIITQAIDYINAHLSEDISVTSIAEHVHSNKSYLMHLFKEKTGYTIKKYITEKRLWKAKYLLQQHASMTDACFQSGFTNYTSFYRAYTSHYGISPRKDRATTIQKGGLSDVHLR